MGIVPDSNGDLWLATNRAPCHFDARRLKASPFTFQRELRRAEFIWNAAYAGVHGEIFFGSNDGLTVFHPDDVVPNAIPLVLAFTDFRVRNEPLPLQARMTAGPTGDGIPEIVLRPEESMFSLEFAALHFAAPDQNQYAYHLDGLDQGWNEIGNRHSVTYSALPPGNYLLSVRASNCDGVSSRDNLKLRVRMLPPWYATWWFRALLAAGGLLLFYVLVLQRAEDEAEQRELAAAFMAFTRDRAGFLVFFREAEDIVRELGRADLSASRRKRLLHTLKGNAGIPGLRRIADICHLAETELEIDDAVSAETMERLQDHSAKVAQALRAVTGGDARAVIELSDGDLDDLALRVQRGASARELLSELAHLRWEPVERPLSRLAEHGRALARRLKGSEVDARVHADALRLDPERWNPLWSALVHLVRNAVDHGLESAEERASAGKPARGTLRFEARCRDGGLRLEIEDDGRGIDWEVVRQLCRRRGLPSETRADLFEALLRPDFSSREHVTETSGRGVGLTAVAASVSERGGTLAVDSEPGRGTLWILKLPLDRGPSTFSAHSSAPSTSVPSTPESVRSQTPSAPRP
jgi:two-component system chemotaxis sensor kinase CheA